MQETLLNCSSCPLLLLNCHGLPFSTKGTRLDHSDIFGIHREVFLDFNQTAVSKLNEKKILTPVSILISEVKLQATVENARQTSKLGALSFIVV
ncbi:hypothetical protein RHGRI_005176 [Rhododendron griersonianum]|uniref:Uncharacterized protein n=1 Tax=Rhododendron griersonianum TaxID=479676 RepID=A0AAV6LCA4_9ERIC|nr:hypothetical protein RHGRI_005176 [Rhododendron griersonianum]